MLKGLRIGILGPLHASGQDGDIALGGRKQRLLLADLVLNIGTSLSSDRLIDDLWGENPPPTAPGTLQAYVSRLRAGLGRDVITRSSLGYSLTPEMVTLDATEFDGLVVSADALAADDPRSAAGLYREALALWRGDMLGEIGLERFARPDVTRREENRAAVMGRLFEVELGLGEASRLVGEIRQAIDRDPLRESLWRQLMLALYRSGRQAEALRAFRELKQHLGTELGITPSDPLVALEERILLQDPLLRRARHLTPHLTPANHPSNLLEDRTPFIGRTTEVQNVLDALDRTTTVTVTGAGGIGKTRLALAVGFAAMGDFPGGVWIADLALERAATRVTAPLLSALDLEWRNDQADVDRIIDRLGGQPALVILDNCEHLQEPATGLARHLAASGNISVLATSRIPLGLAGEAVIPLESLELPQDADDLGTFRKREAVALFELMGEVRHPGFRVTAANQASISGVLSAVDGVPLAIELAASMLPLWTPAQLADQLDQQLFGSLVGPAGRDGRRSSMRSVIELSYDLLDPVGRTLFDRLSVFRGPFNSDHAAHACSDTTLLPTSVGDHLEALTASSVLQRAPEQGTGWYRLLEVMREYGAERLEARGETARWRSRHAEMMRDVALESSSRFHDDRQAATFDELRSVGAQFLAALEHLESTEDRLTGTTIVRALWRWWFLDGELDFGVYWTDALGNDSTDIRGALMLLLSERNGPDRDGVGTDRDRIMELHRSLETTIASETDANGLLSAGDALTGMGAFAEAEQLLVPAQQWFHANGPVWAEGLALLRLAMVEGFGKEDMEAGDAFLARAFPVIESSGDTQLITYTHLVRSDRTRLHGDYNASLQHASAARSGYSRLGLRLYEYEARLYEAMNLIDLGRHDEAERTIEDLHSATSRRNLVRWDWIADALRGALSTHRGDYDEAIAILEPAADIAAGLDDHSLGVTLNQLVMARLGAGDTTGAERDAARTLEIWARRDYPWHRTVAHIVAAESAAASGEPNRAHELLADAGRLCRMQRHPSGMARVLDVLAALARANQDAEATVRRLAAADMLRDDVGVPPSAWAAGRNRAALRWASRVLGGDSVNTIWSDGEQDGRDWLVERGSLD
jgi:predicted ATPase/DNA-binding SARP family transcriptional activator